MKVIVVSAHPDDEIIGAGGTLLRHVHNGDELFELMVTSAYCPDWTEEECRMKPEEASKVAFGKRTTDEA